MSRLFSRFSVRAISVVLLLVGVAGGVYLSQDRQSQQQGIDAQLAAQADHAERQVLQDQQSAHAAAIAPQREAEAEAAAKAAGAAKAAAARAEKAKVVVSRQAPRQVKPGTGNADSGDGAPGAKPKPYTGPIPKSCKEFSGNRRIGCAVLVSRGMSMEQMGCLDDLWRKESGWNHKALNKSSRAYGIPQALPGIKMKSAGEDWATNPETQIKWGLGYIKARYGSPCEAFQHSKNTGWY